MADVQVTNPDTDFTPNPTLVFKERDETITGKWSFNDTVKVVQGVVEMGDFTVGQEATNVVATFKSDFVTANTSWRFYRTRSASGPTNDYQRLAFNWSPTGVTLATEAQGTGTGTPDLDIVPEGTLRFGWEASLRINTSGADVQPELNEAVNLGSTSFRWGSVISKNLEAIGGIVSLNDGTTARGALDTVRRSAPVTSDGRWRMYTTDGLGASYPFDIADNLVLQAESATNADIVFMAGNTPKVLGAFVPTLDAFGSTKILAFELPGFQPHVGLEGAQQGSRITDDDQMWLYQTVAGGSYPFDATGRGVIQAPKSNDIALITSAGDPILAARNDRSVLNYNGVYWATNDGFEAGLTAPVSPGASVSWALPKSDGASGWALTTDGAGSLSFRDIDSSLDAATLNGQPGSFYQNASNLNAGVLADARVQESNVTQYTNKLVLTGQTTELNTGNVNVGGTSSTAWTNLTLTAVPAGATAALLVIQARIGNQGTWVEVREQGSSDMGVGTSQENANLDSPARSMIVPVDASGNVEYRLTNGNLSAQNCRATIYTIGYYI